MKFAPALLILPLLGLSCGGPIHSKPHVAPGRYVKSVQEGDIRRRFVLRVPKSYDNKSELPLVIVLHGWSSSAEDAESFTAFGAKAEREGFIVAFPEGTAGIGDLKGWNSGVLDLGAEKVDDVKFIGDVLDSVESSLYVDEHRVYVAGHSNGAMMAYDVAAAMSDRIAAIAVVSGTLGVDGNRAPEPQGPVSAIILHGQEDPVVPYDASHEGLIKCESAPSSARWWAEQDGCGSSVQSARGDVMMQDFPGGRGGTEVELVTIPKGDHTWPGSAQSPTSISATDMIWDFFKSHPKRD